MESTKKKERSEECTDEIKQKNKTYYTINKKWRDQNDEEVKEDEEALNNV